MQSLADIRAALEARGLRPRRSLGQNFLIDHNLVRKLVDHAGVAPGSLVLEVGPGTGVLTDALVERGAEVVAAELDRGLADLLRERFGPRITLVEGDCLDGPRALAPGVCDALGARAFVLVANLPYGCATPLIITLLVRHPACAGLHVTIQREVAERLTAGPGSKAYGALSVLARTLTDARTIAALPPECFWPRPEVTSAMVSLIRRAPRPTPLSISNGDPQPNADPVLNRSDDVARAESLEAWCARVFANRRKQLGSVLGRETPWPEGVRPTDRAESLSPGALIALGRATGELIW